MKDNIVNIKEGIKLHLIDTSLFKTDLSVIFITIPLDRKNVTKDVIIPEILKDGSMNYKTQKELSDKLYDMYGSSLEVGLDKTGKNLVLKIFIESIDDEFLPEKEENLKENILCLLDVALNPFVIDEAFEKNRVDIEKEIRKIEIESEKDDKDSYSEEQAIHIMYKNCGYGINKNGYIEDLDSINEKNLYERYNEILNTGKIDIFVAGNINNKNIEEIIKNNENIKKLNPRKTDMYYLDITKETKEKLNSVNKVDEEMSVVQGKLVIGLDILEQVNSDDRFKILLYNTILGDGANSKLFRIVREKESLAYTCKSKYIAQKSNILIKAGIDIGNYEKTVSLIEKLIEDMKNGDFTEEDLENAKRYIYMGIDNINEDKATAVVFFYGEEMSLNKITVDEYYKKIEAVTKEDVVEIANRIQENLIYFLKNE